VIGYGKRRQLKLSSAFGEVLDTTGTIQKAVFAVYVKVSEARAAVGRCHGDLLVTQAAMVVCAPAATLLAPADSAAAQTASPDIWPWWSCPAGGIIPRPCASVNSVSLRGAEGMSPGKSTSNDWLSRLARGPPCLRWSVPGPGRQAIGLTGAARRQPDERLPSERMQPQDPICGV
jgi:hypothetical protein